MLHFYSKKVDPFQKEALLDAALLDAELKEFGLIEKNTGRYELADGSLAFVLNDILPPRNQRKNLLASIYPKFAQSIPAAYPNCGVISAKLNNHFREMVASIIPTDHVSVGNDILGFPSRLLDRTMIRLRASEILPISFGAYSRYEADAKTEAGWRWSIAGGVGDGFGVGDLLKYPCFVPSGIDGSMRISDYFKEKSLMFKGKEGLANYLYGVTILLHLKNRSLANERNIDRSFQKIRFGIFKDGLPIFRSEEGKLACKKGAEYSFRELCHGAGFFKKAWGDMPGFDILKFEKFSRWNWRTGRIRLVGYYGTPHDGSYRTKEDTRLGIELIRSGQHQRGIRFLQEYMCSAYAKIAGQDQQGGLSKDILWELSGRHWRLMEMLMRDT